MNGAVSPIFEAGYAVIYHVVLIRLSESPLQLADHVAITIVARRSRDLRFSYMH